MVHEFDGRKYQKASAHQQEWIRKLIGELDLRGNEQVLDIGCSDVKMENRASQPGAITF